MIKHVLEQIGGVGLYGIFSLVLFFTFFTIMLIWALRLKKGYIQSMKQLPLDSAMIPYQAGEDNHER